MEDNMVSAKMTFKIPTKQKVHMAIKFDGSRLPMKIGITNSTRLNSRLILTVNISQ
jgi:hypothetical protein